jgi:hypothetical protein
MGEGDDMTQYRYCWVSSWDEVLARGLLGWRIIEVNEYEIDGDPRTQYLMELETPAES